MEVLAVIFLVFVAVFAYLDHHAPDTKAESIHPFDHETVNANNERKRKQIQELEDKIRKLNYADPSREFYREGARILEREPTGASKTSQNTRQAYYKGVYQYDVQKRVERKFALGITEYPTLISLLDVNKAFTEDGRSVVLTLDASNSLNERYLELGSLKATIKESEDLWRIKNSEEGKMIERWIDRIQIVGINEDQESATYEIVISIPNEILLTDEYITYEISNTGRVPMVNLVNNHRHMLGSVGENTIERVNGRLMVFVDRRQVVPFFIDRKQRVMSQKQITRNIKNRLWNRVDVRYVSMEDNIYCGEIIFDL